MKEVNRKLDELGINALALSLNKMSTKPASTKGKNQHRTNHILKILIHQSISLKRTFKEIVLMKTMNLMSWNNPSQSRCFFYLVWVGKILAMHFNDLYCISILYFVLLLLDAPHKLFFFSKRCLHHINTK